MKICSCLSAAKLAFVYFIFTLYSVLLVCVYNDLKNNISAYRLEKWTIILKGKWFKAVKCPP